MGEEERIRLGRARGSQIKNDSLTLRLRPAVFTEPGRCGQYQQGEKSSHMILSILIGKNPNMEKPTSGIFFSVLYEVLIFPPNVSTEAKSPSVRTLFADY